MTELKRDLGVFAALAIVVGTVIGSGIFRVPQAMILNVGSVRLVFLVWVVGGVLSLAGALTYAELAAAMPGAGGEYVYLTEAYGPLWGFLYSWTQMWVAKSGSIATLATAFFEYTAHFVPQFELVWFTAGPFSVKYGQVFALVLILLLGGVNYLGVRVGGDVQVAVERHGAVVEHGAARPRTPDLGDVPLFRRSHLRNRDLCDRCDPGRYSNYSAAPTVTQTVVVDRAAASSP